MKMQAHPDATADEMSAWPEDIFGILQRFDVRLVPYVPDAGHSQLIERVKRRAWRCWPAPGPAASVASC
jgi:hypothetical protein